MSNREVVILSGVRTAIGDYGGSLKDIPPHELAARVVKEAMARSDWGATLAAIRRMPDAQRTDSRWLYFAARTSELTGDAAGARTLYRQAASKADFHGFLAADKLEQAYALCPWQPAAAPPPAGARTPAGRRPPSTARSDAARDHARCR